MPNSPNLSYRVTKVQRAVLNNAGDSVENPIVQGAYFTLKIHKWHKDVKLKKAWVTVNGKIYRVFTNNVTSETDEYISWSFVAQPPYVAVSDPPQRNIFHITTTNGQHSPVRYRHTGKTEENTTGLTYDKSVVDRPGGSQVKFSIWIASTPSTQVLLDGFNGSQNNPLVYPMYPTGSEGDVTSLVNKTEYSEGRAFRG